MPDARHWFSTATDHLSAAQALASGGHWRSACSRAYYAAHNAAHAVVVHLEPALSSSPRSIPHGELGPKLFRIVRKHGILGELAANVLRQRLLEAYNVRVESDYKPTAKVDESAYGQARAPAREAVELARRLIA